MAAASPGEQATVLEPVGLSLAKCVGHSSKGGFTDPGPPSPNQGHSRETPAIRGRESCRRSACQTPLCDRRVQLEKRILLMSVA